MSERGATTDRRGFLAATATLFGSAAGCTGSGGPATGGTATASPTRSADPTPTASPELDLREANVMAVAVERSGDAYRFEVTLYHDDDGEDGYANWWQVETVGGEQLGRRELRHPHGTRRFTRSETVEVGEDVDCVVVRGHDGTHGYGGRAVLVDPGTGATSAVHQGADRRPFTAGDCP